MKSGVAAGMDIGATELALRTSGIASEVRRLAARANQDRNIPSEVIEAIREADLLRVFQPKRWGGLEADPRAFFDVQNILSEACASTGWVYGVLSVQSFIISLFDERAQADVWSEDGGGVACSSYQALGTVTSAKGGYRLSGRWTFASGASHAQWALVGGVIPGRPPSPGVPPLFLVPRCDYEIVDTWHTWGLCATGSNDLQVDDAFVPEHRMLTLDPGLQNLTVGSRPGPPLYRLPWFYLFTSSISNFAVGAARHALDVFLEVTSTRVAAFTGKVAREDPAVQETAARMRAAIDTAESMFKRHIALLVDHVERDEAVPMADALMLRAQMTATVRMLAAIADEMMMMLGGRGLYLNSPLTRAWLDLMAARGHVGNNPATAAGLLGKTLLEQAADRRALQTSSRRWA